MASSSMPKLGLVDFDESLSVVENFAEAVCRQLTKNCQCGAHKNYFLLFVAICSKETGAMGGQMNDLSDKNLGKMVLTDLKRGQPRQKTLLDRISSDVKTIQSIKAEMSKFLSLERSRVTKKAISKGGKYFLPAANEFKPGQCPFSIEKCKTIEIGQVYLNGLLSVYHRSSSAKAVENFHQSLSLEVKVWRYWSFYGACLKHLDLGRTVAASDSLNKCLSAFKSLQAWVFNNISASPPPELIPKLKSDDSLQTVAEEPSKKDVTTEPSVDSGSEETIAPSTGLFYWFCRALGLHQTKDPTVTQKAKKQSAVKQKAEDVEKGNHLQTNLDVVEEHLRNKETNVKELERESKLQQDEEERRISLLQKRKEESKQTQKENERLTQQVKNLKETLALQIEKNRSINEAETPAESRKDASTQYEPLSNVEDQRAVSHVAANEVAICDGNGVMNNPDNDSSALSGDLHSPKTQKLFANQLDNPSHGVWGDQLGIKVEELRQKDKELKQREGKLKRKTRDIEEKDKELHFLRRRIKEMEAGEKAGKNGDHEMKKPDENSGDTNKPNASSTVKNADNLTGSGRTAVKNSHQSSVKIEVEKISDSRRPSETAKRFQDLFTHTYSVVECFEDAKRDKYDDRESSNFLLGILKTVQRAASLQLSKTENVLVKAFDLSDSIDNPVAKSTIKDSTVSICKLSSHLTGQACVEIWRKAVEFQNWRKKKNEPLQPNIFKSLDDFAKKCVPVYWDMLLQKRSLIPVFNHTTFYPSHHERFFGSDKASSKIDYFVWPCLIEEGTNRVLVKGKVVTRTTDSPV